MRTYFCGWYFKCQSDTQTLAVIASIHKSKAQQSCSIQLITDENAWSMDFPYNLFSKGKSKLSMNIDKNRFSENGIQLRINTTDINISGNIKFSNLTPIKYDIMGPFRYVPFMECRHSVASMKHRVNGDININGSLYRFIDDIGYIEGDRGYSFPKEYAWTQCCFTDGSLMLSVADIPIGSFHFTGIICVILFQGKEYRLATYLGAKAVKIQNGEVIIRQRDIILSAKLLKKNSHPLSAPSNGIMSRTIHESASCHAAYHFEKNNNIIFDFKTSRASFEYEYPL